MHLPNTVESVITFLGVLRAGMTAVPLPLLWRKADIVKALARVGAKALVAHFHEFLRVYSYADNDSLVMKIGH